VVTLLDTIIGYKRPSKQNTLVIASSPSPHLQPEQRADATEVMEVMEFDRKSTSRCLPTYQLKNLDSSCPTQFLFSKDRFNQPGARLYRLIGRKVRTPGGSGTLVQVFAERVTVLLDTDLNKCSFFSPTDIEPVSPELD
jgi:hypothetical protein